MTDVGRIVTPDEHAQLEAAAHALRSWPPLQLDLTAEQGFALVGELQLALRHPLNTGFGADIARAVIESLRRTLPPQLRPLIAAGDRAELDETSSEAIELERLQRIARDKREIAGNVWARLEDAQQLSDDLADALGWLFELCDEIDPKKTDEQEAE